jgi:protein-S-isoprenylcysteine O-methyltransferase Ste14
MTLAIIATGTFGFAALLVPDLCRLAGRQRLAVAASVAGYAAVLAALVLQLVAFRPAGPLPMRVGAFAASVVFTALLVYSAVLEIPLRNRGAAGRTSPVLYTGGTYRLSRHPGMLWYLLMELSLNAAYLDVVFALVSATLVLGDLALVLLQDRCLFPQVLPGYADYRLRVPFLFPRFGGVKGDSS